MPRLMTFVLLTIALIGIDAPAEATAPQPARAGIVRARETTLMHTSAVVVPAEAPSATLAADSTSKPWMLLGGAAAAMALAVRRRHSY